MTPSELLAIAEECGKYWQCEGMCGKDQHGVEANVVIALLRVMEAAETVVDPNLAAPKGLNQAQALYGLELVLRAALTEFHRAAEEEMGKGRNDERHD